MYFYAAIELRVLPRTKQRWKSLSAISSRKCRTSSSSSSGEEDEEKEEEKAEKYLLQREESYETNESHAPAMHFKKLDLSLYASLLNSVNTPKSLQNGRFAHHIITHIGLEPDTFVGSHVVLMYGTCGALDDAFHVFENLLERRSIFSWNFIVRAFARHGDFEKVLFLVGLMQQQGVFPSKVTFVSVFDACSLLSTINVGLRMHTMIVGCPFEMDVVIATALVNMYGKFGRIEIAMHCFDLMREHDVIAWTALISAFLQCGKAMEARSLFDQMMQEAWMPNEVSFISLFDACEDISSLGLGKQVHVRITCNHSSEAKLAVANALVNMYGKCGCLLSAKLVFKKMEEYNLVTWTSMISAYSQNGHHKEAIQHFLHLQQIGMLPDNILFSAVLSACGNSRVISLCKQMHAINLFTEPMVDVFLGTILVNTYGKCRDMEHAQSVFYSIADKNIFSWNAMISAYSQNGCNEDAYHLFDQMHEEAIFPNNVTFLSIVNACANDPSGLAVKRGAQIHACAMQLDIDVQNALIDMYASLGLISNARRVFDTLPERDICSWSALIAAFVDHDCSEEALKLFQEMQFEGISPDGIAFSCALKACSCMGAADKGQEIHAEISRKSILEGYVPVGNALVDMYINNGFLKEAQEVLIKLPARDTRSWITLVTGYAKYGQVEQAFKYFEEIQKDPGDALFMTCIDKGEDVSQELSRKREESNKEKEIGFVSILNACSHAGAVDTGNAYFEALNLGEYGPMPTLEHYMCMIDLLSRAGQVDDALRVITLMPFHPNLLIWHTVLSASKKWGIVELGEHAFAHAVQLNVDDTSAYVCMHNIYIAAHMQG